MSKLDEIRERLEAIPPGSLISSKCVVIRLPLDEMSPEHEHRATCTHWVLADLYANAPADIAYLLEVVELLRGVVTTATIACGAVDLEAAEDIDRWRDNWGEVIRDEVLDATQRVRAILEGKT